MPRNMSFALTTQQMRDRTKTVTRRMGWRNLKPGTVINAVEKCMGLPKGAKVQHLCQIRVKSNTPEPLHTITADECNLEGFPDLNPAEFIDLFCKANNCKPTETVNRIEYEFLEVNP